MSWIVAYGWTEDDGSLLSREREFDDVDDAWEFFGEKGSLVALHRGYIDFPIPSD